VRSLSLSPKGKVGLSGVATNPSELAPFDRGNDRHIVALAPQRAEQFFTLTRDCDSDGELSYRKHLAVIPP
jgi:hypothetical protein